jgi:hypothetical protein
MVCIPVYPMPEIRDFQRTNSEFAKSEQQYPVKINLEYAHKYSLLCNDYPTAWTIYHQRDIFRKKLTKFDPWSLHGDRAVV